MMVCIFANDNLRPRTFHFKRTAKESINLGGSHDNVTSRLGVDNLTDLANLQSESSVLEWLLHLSTVIEIKHKNNSAKQAMNIMTICNDESSQLILLSVVCIHVCIWCDHLPAKETQAASALTRTTITTKERKKTRQIRQYFEQFSRG